MDHFCGGQGYRSTHADAGQWVFTGEVRDSGRFDDRCAWCEKQELRITFEVRHDGSDDTCLIMQGEVVQNLGCRSSWCQIASTMGVRGWASKRYLVAYGNGGVVQRPSSSGIAQTTKCAKSPNACIAEARQVCGGSYAVLDSDSHAGGLVSDALPGPVTWYQMTYQSGPSNGTQPSFVFRGQSPGIAVPSQLPSFGGGMAVAVSDMGRYCVGEASAYFSERPQNMATLPVEQYGGQYIVYGQFPPDGSNVTTFQCYFDGGGQFLRVQ